MIWGLYSIKDVVTEWFSTPFTAETDKAAVRSYETSRKNQPYPEDFELYSVGTMDPVSGSVEGHMPRLISATEPRKKGKVIDE
jgi:hypothetical protein